MALKVTTPEAQSNTFVEKESVFVPKPQDGEVQEFIALENEKEGLQITFEGYSYYHPEHLDNALFIMPVDDEHDINQQLKELADLSMDMLENGAKEDELPIPAFWARWMSETEEHTYENKKPDGTSNPRTVLRSKNWKVQKFIHLPVLFKEGDAWVSRILLLKWSVYKAMKGQLKSEWRGAHFTITRSGTGRYGTSYDFAFADLKQPIADPKVYKDAEIIDVREHVLAERSDQRRYVFSKWGTVAPLVDGVDEPIAGVDFPAEETDEE